MAKVKLCKECGVPLLVSKGQTWHSNGVITETKDPDHRMLFYESENLDSLFRGISAIIGMPIDRIVIESKRRVTREYLEKMIPAVVRKAIFILNPSLISLRMANIGKAMGYGDIQLVDMKRAFVRKEKEYLVMTIRKPYSFLFFRGDNLGGMEAASGRECKVESEKIGEDLYRLEIRIGTHPPELQERLKAKVYKLKPGNIEFERCTNCNIPLDVARCHWNLDDGIITDPHTGRRMALFGPGGIEAIFDDLEAELGETIPAAVIEAQKRYIKENFSSEYWNQKLPTMRQMLAARGLGLLTRLERDDQHFSLTIQNACIPLFMVGLAQGLYELITGKNSTSYEYSMSDDGVLDITIRA